MPVDDHGDVALEQLRRLPVGHDEHLVRHGAAQVERRAGRRSRDRAGGHDALQTELRRAEHVTLVHRLIDRLEVVQVAQQALTEQAPHRDDDQRQYDSGSTPAASSLARWFDRREVVFAVSQRHGDLATTKRRYRTPAP